MPVGLNPHFLPQAEQQITRAALSAENAGDVDLLNSNGALELEVRRLDTLVQQSLGNFSFGLLKTKKRRLEREISRDSAPLTTTPFRLVSSTLQPQLISLLPSYHEAIPHQRPAEDTPAEERLRRERAEQVAVDADWVFLQSQLQQKSSEGPVLKPLSPTGYHTPFHLSNLLVTQISQSGLHSARERTIPEGVKFCPLVPIKDSTSSPIISKKRKRKRGNPPRARPPPQFFRPMQEWRGKSAGYAMGWNGSHPTTWTGSRRYIRDTMRKGTTLSRLEHGR